MIYLQIRTFSNVYKRYVFKKYGILMKILFAFLVRPVQNSHGEYRAARFSAIALRSSLCNVRRDRFRSGSRNQRARCQNAPIQESFGTGWWGLKPRLEIRYVNDEESGWRSHWRNTVASLPEVRSTSARTNAFQEVCYSIISYIVCV